MISEDFPMNDEIICIYFSDEPYVDATITKEELLAALKKQRGETSLHDDAKCTIR